MAGKPKLHLVSSRRTPSTEWLGVRRRAPFFIVEQGEPRRPDIVLWMEMPTGIVLAHALREEGEDPSAIAQALGEAMAAPLAGPPRQPDAVRIEDEQDEDAVSAVLPPSVPVSVAPCPEIEDVLESMGETLATEETEVPSYFEGGRVGADAVQGFFVAAENLYRVAPWKIVDETVSFHVDIPDLGIRDACLTVIGSGDEARGFALYPSLEACIAMEEYVAEMDYCHDCETVHPSDDAEAPPYETLYLLFEKSAEIPPEMRQEAKKHGWRVAGARAWPVVVRHTGDGVPVPILERDMQTLTSCARALAAMCKARPEIFALYASGDGEIEAACTEVGADGSPACRMIFPFEAGEIAGVVH